MTPHRLFKRIDKTSSANPLRERKKKLLKIFVSEADESSMIKREQMTGNAFQRPYFFCHFTSFLYVCYLMKEKEFLCETRGFPNPTASGTNPMFLKKKGKTYYTGHLLLAHSPLRKKTQPQLLSNPNCYNSHLTDLQECNYLSLCLSVSLSHFLSWKKKEPWH